MSSTFWFAGREYPKFFFYPDPNNLNQSERVVEITLGRMLLKEHREHHVLEVGNVMRQYLPGQYLDMTVIDKHERERPQDVTKIDIVDLETSDRYDLILSISTLEHVGFNEEGIGETRDAHPDPLKINRAIDVMKGVLAPGGDIWVTWAVGANPQLDELVRASVVAFPDEYFLKRVNQENDWRECGRDEALATRYGTPFPAGNALYIGHYRDARTIT